MKKTGFFLLLFFLISTAFQENNFKTFKFNSLDGLEITADLYEINPEKPYILLCHQASFSRGEYRETAPKLNNLGFNCLAIDQRSGDGVNNVVNQTKIKAKIKGLPTNYFNAEQDIIAAINYLSKKTKTPIILLGSSYSASLVLKIGKENENVSKIIAYSPGEYYKEFNVSENISGMEKPVYVTSSKNESNGVNQLVKGIAKKYITHFIPKESGKHGSKALWSKTENNKEYWESLKEFLLD